MVLCHSTIHRSGNDTSPLWLCYGTYYPTIIVPQKLLASLLQDEQLAKEQEDHAKNKAMEEEREQIEKDKLDKQQQQQQQQPPLEGNIIALVCCHTGSGKLATLIL